MTVSLGVPTPNPPMGEIKTGRQVRDSSMSYTSEPAPGGRGVPTPNNRFGSALAAILPARDVFAGRIEPCTQGHRWVHQANTGVLAAPVILPGVGQRLGHRVWDAGTEGSSPSIRTQGSPVSTVPRFCRVAPCGRAAGNLPKRDSKLTQSNGAFMTRGASHGQLHSVAQAYSWRCFYCGANLRCAACHPRGKKRIATRDHVVPLSRGGVKARTNLAAACFECNQAKADLLLTEFLSADAKLFRPTRDPKPLTHRIKIAVLSAHSLDCWVMVFCALNPGRPLAEGPPCNCGLVDAAGDL